MPCGYIHYLTSIATCIVRFHSQCYALIQQILIRTPAIFTSNVTKNIMLFGDEQFTGYLYSSLAANPVIM